MGKDAIESEDERDRLFDIIDAHFDHLTLKAENSKEFICIFENQKFLSKNQCRMHLYRQHQEELRQLQNNVISKVNHKRAVEKEPVPLIRAPSTTPDDMERNDALFALQLGLQFYEEDCLDTKDSVAYISKSYEKGRHEENMPMVSPSPQMIIRRIQKRKRVSQTDFFKTSKRVQERDASDSEESRQADPQERSQRLELLIKRMDRMHTKILSSLSSPHEMMNNIEAPVQLQGTLRDYQVVGLRWLYNLYASGMNGILADEMVRKYEMLTQ